MGFCYVPSSLFETRVCNPHISSVYPLTSIAEFRPRGTGPHPSIASLTQYGFWKRPDPPVFSLPRDVLEEIFIRVNKPSVLCDVKSISQVCRHWREIVVGWSSLWGRAISVDQLNQVRDDWRTEVLHRTKTSALHIF